MTDYFIFFHGAFQSWLVCLQVPLLALLIFVMNIQAIEAVNRMQVYWRNNNQLDSIVQRQLIISSS